MPAPNELDPSASVMAYWGSELRRLREAMGWSQQELAKRTAYSTSLVGLVETAMRAPTRKFAQRCDEVLETGGALIKLWPLIGRESSPTWVRSLFELEWEARTLRNYQLAVVPGLLQTEDYARTLTRLGRPFDTVEQVEEMVTVRMQRQRLLDRPEPPILFVLLDEAVLARPIGGARVMREQLEHLLEATARPRVTLQVIPFEVGAYPGLAGPMLVLSFRGAPDVVYMENAENAQLLTDPARVDPLSAQFDALRSWALPQAASAAFIEKRMSSWI
ncbi:helix-turn-helix transcriptional regulator [Streptosporangium sp. NBC_01639]|uniref:helix-turn-helix domain-containing protein n=1 Tax=unclassified Streptosporangium TaxID=2632669 RepID=UPI002DDB82A6|nr:helix-turn-helix transcriptional regulator [Streptosporangium sp. NBC_01756]WSC85604.1 helix-turn-helix transcriptional regulator [Streptosporangium sp. NBC_01756]WTD55720.1 helix-turn-helix transcriptional regulator [Streptosporangium sp. NBC_01639]